MKDCEHVFVLDIDDTIYLERDYVSSGFAAVGTFVSDLFGYELFGEHCKKLMDQGHRRDIFDRVLREVSLPCDEATVRRLVDCYRNHTPDISPLPDAQMLLRLGQPLAYISDGPLISQQRKVESLRLAEFSDVIMLTDLWGREFWKPHPRAFETVERHFSSSAKFTYIGDNPTKDFHAPKQLGWQTIRIRRPGGLHRDTPNAADCLPDREIESLEEIAHLHVGS